MPKRYELTTDTEFYRTTRLTPSSEAAQTVLSSFVIVVVLQVTIFTVVGALAFILSRRFQSEVIGIWDVAALSFVPWLLFTVYSFKLVAVLFTAATCHIGQVIEVVDDEPEPPSPERPLVINAHAAHITGDGLPAGDLRWFVRGLESRGHTQRAWVGLQAPSGRTVDAYYWRELCRPLRAAGVLRGVSEREAGHLAVVDEGEVLRLLGLPASPASSGRASGRQV